MAIFNSKLFVYQRVNPHHIPLIQYIRIFDMSTVGLKRAELDWAAALSQTMPATPAHSSEMEAVFDTKNKVETNSLTLLWYIYGAYYI